MRAEGYGNSNNYDVGKTLAFDNENNLIIAGEFYGGITFGTNTLVSSGGSDIFVAKLDDNNTNVPQNEVTQKIKIFPNPNNGKFIIQNNLQTNTDIVIYNLNGEKVYESRVNDNNTIDISNLTKGMYFLKIIKSNNIFVEKIIIQ